MLEEMLAVLFVMVFDYNEFFTLMFGKFSFQLKLLLCEIERLANSCF